ncbi:histidine phosphatase family protein [Paenibacillus sp. CN-4]|uniref:histidine phosphatase family protein n=1 Tax=Paenibacillus nanchangensis TaxID=3348343 RepID=UPI00397E1C7E
MNTHIYLVRHAHSNYSSDELNRPLSERGKRDADKVTEILKKEGIQVLISSPYKRAVQTIEGLADTLGASIVIENSFRERTLAGQPVDDFESALSKVWEDDCFAWEGGESNLDARQRGVEALTTILKQYPGKNIAVGTHGNLMVLIMNHFDKRYDFAFWKQLKMPDIYKLTFNGFRLVEVEQLAVT